MILDVLCLLVLAAAAVSGALGGALRQLAKLGAAGLALAGTRLVAAPVAAAMASTLPRPIVGPLASAVTFCALYVLLALVLGILARAARSAGAVPGSVDRGAGALLGGAKAGLVLWVLVSALVAWGRPLPFLGAALDAPRSDFAAFARDHGAFGPKGGLRHLPASLGGEPRNARERRDAAAVEWSAGDGPR